MVGAGSADEAPAERGFGHLLEHMLFKGTRSVGVREPERERVLLAEIDAVAAEVRRLEGRGGRRAAERRQDLARRLAELRRGALRYARPGELSLLYSEAGGVELNAHTLEDLTFFYVSLPPEKLELWFWLESDRLLEPVFRQLASEIEVVAEERRMRIETAPTGPLDQEVRRRFWGPLPYAWRPLGFSGDLATAERPALIDFFRRHYRASNLTAVVVGQVEPDRARHLAERYFGRLPAAEAAGAAPATWRAEPPAEAFTGSCDCPPQVRLLYPTVPFRHPDGYSLQVLAGLLNGRSGRLHRRLVLEWKLATVAEAGQRPLRRAGSFAVRAVARDGVEPRALVDAWDRLVAELASAPADAEELERTRAQMEADALRRLKEPGHLLRQLLIYAGLGHWREIEEWSGRIRAVTADEVQAAARGYLVGHRRMRAVYLRRSGAAPAVGEPAAGPAR